MKKEEYYQRLTYAINFVEDNLDNKISLTSVSENAFSSLSHFHRIFYFMTGLTIKEYIRHRRLSNAAIKLVTTKKPVLAIALESQFESPESFNKSFKKLFGLSPKEFRNKKPEFEVMSRMLLNRNEELKQPDDISFNFVYLPRQIVMGMKTRTTLDNGQQTRDIPAFFEAVMKANLLSNIPNVLDQNKIFGIYSDMNNTEEFDYTVGLLVEAAATEHEK
jgi:AraC family transcriptional regulator